MLKMQFDPDSFTLQMKNIKDNIVDKASVHALNRTLSQLKTYGQNEVKSTLKAKLTRKDFNKKFFIDKARSNKRRGVLQIRDRGTPLIKFSPKRVIVQSRIGRRKGVSVQETSDRYLSGGFIAKFQSGRSGIFQRTGTSRSPIKEMKSMAVGELFKRSDVGTRMRDYARASFQKNYANDYQFYKNKALKGGK